MHAVEVEGVVKRYGERAALSGVSFRVDRGELFALLGPNGGGKTTLFRILATLLRPDAGTTRILGVEGPAVRRRIGVCFQDPSLDRKLTVRENLVHQGHLYGLRGRALRARIGELLGKFGLSDRAGDRVELLSGGLRRRVELAKALLHAPEVLLLDEPSTGLDPGARLDLWKALRESGATVVLTTHILEEADDASRIALLDRGALVAMGTPDELKREIGGDVVAVAARDPERVRDTIRDRFGGAPEILNGHVRIERPDGHRFVAQLFEAIPGEIEAVTVGRPTLEDVFIRRTGRKFE